MCIMLNILYTKRHVKIETFRLSGKAKNDITVNIQTDTQYTSVMCILFLHFITINQKLLA